jgi:hypothetical protein
LLGHQTTNNQGGGINMSQLRSLFVIFFVLMVLGCAWQRIPAAPEYTIEAPIPLKVGVIVADNEASTLYGPAILNEWKEMRLFESLIYPYREGDLVDVIMKLSVNGGWKGSGVGAGFVTGLTLGLAGTVVGPSMTGTHDAQAILNKATSEVGRYSVQVTSTVEFGMFANVNEVAKKTEELQRRKLALELANKIRADRQNLLAQINK